MEIITNVTVQHIPKAGEKKVSLAPGEHDLPDEVAKDLIKRGFALSASKAKAEAAAAAKAAAGTVKVETKGSGPKVEQK